MRKQVVWSAVALIFSSLIVATTSASLGCANRDCEPHPWVDVTGGRMIDQDTYETSGATGEWTLFRSSSGVSIKNTVFPGRRIATTQAFISSDISPTDSSDPVTPDDWALASGDLAHFVYVKDEQGETVNVVNKTCADLYVRVVLTFYPESPTVPFNDGDAAAEATSGSADSAASDAPLD